METVAIYCRARGCRRESPIARVRRPALVTVHVEAWCGKCRNLLWYVVRPDGTVTLATPAPVGVMSG